MMWYTVSLLCYASNVTYICYIYMYYSSNIYIYIDPWKVLDFIWHISLICPLYHISQELCIVVRFRFSLILSPSFRATSLVLGSDRPNTIEATRNNIGKCWWPNRQCLTNRYSRDCTTPVMKNGLRTWLQPDKAYKTMRIFYGAWSIFGWKYQPELLLSQTMTLLSAPYNRMGHLPLLSRPVPLFSRRTASDHGHMKNFIPVWLTWYRDAI